MICPRCQHERQEHDPSVPPGVCPGCGIAYAKWQPEATQLPHGGPPQSPVRATPPERSASAEPLPAPEGLWSRVYHYACFVPSDRHESALWGHTVLFICFAVWGWRFIAHGVDWTFIGGSFLHSVNLPFHEYGHLMFSPFGTFWMFLGGSLFQILLPLIPLGVFMVLQRDNFAASLMLWWSGQNFIDVAPYIADAPLRAIPLISGNDASHDWWNLLMMTNSLELAPALANLCFVLGAGIILLSNAWGAHLLWIEFCGRTRPPLELSE